jgi:catechol 2,3-dioxygenase-like lactoylglutathione lyase family enzyme
MIAGCEQEIPVPSRLERVQPVLMVRDVPASIRFYVERLGFTLTFEDVPGDPKYAGVKRDGVELHLQWHDAKEWEYPNDRPTYRFVVQDVDGLFEELRTRGGLSPTSEVRDTPWGTREFHVQDPDRNGLQFYRNR